MRDETINLVIQKLTENIDLKVQFQPEKNSAFDGTLKIVYNNNRESWLVESKKEARKTHLPALYQLHENHPNLLLVAGIISSPVRQELKKKGIAYLDMAGNAFLNQRILVYIDGRKPDTKPVQPGRVFTNAGLKAIFLFLLKEDLLNTTYREIARKAGIALGNIPRIFEGLTRSGFLIRQEKNRYKLINKNALFERWVTEYNEKLKPTLFLGRYRFLQRQISNWSEIQLDFGTSWGGEPAADKLTDYIKPEALTIYTEESKTDAMKKYQLIPDEKGYIELYKKFWQDDTNQVETVPPLLVYADLIGTADARNVEAAQIIQEQYLENLKE